MTEVNIQNILAERGRTHGSFDNQARMAQLLKRTLRDTYVTGGVKIPRTFVQEDALDMICHKLARIVCGNANVKDHWVDIAGYATLIANTLKE
jgi:riboflavin biosynthesis pyrimidine reductase